jgi:3-methyladenine DNA glycosylase AlkD
VELDSHRMSPDDAVSLAAEVRREIARSSRVDTTSVRAIRRRYSKQLANEPPATLLRFVRSLLKHGTWAERVVAWEVLAGHEARTRVTDRLAAEMARGLSDWASIDLYGVTVLGQAWRDGYVSDATIHSWARSSDRWLRRLALVATVPLNIRSRGGEGNARRTLRVCRMLLDDRDDMVVKAMSWALRELAKRDPKVVEAFLRKESDRLAPRVRREVWSKLRTGLKSATI